MANFPIVGIGSSAGGLEALQKLFGAMRPDAGLAFIIAAHLDPTQESHLTELLSRCTKMPVMQIENSTEIEPDHVYVIAPDQELTIKGGVVRTHKPTAPRGHRHPVDSFFRSMAEDQGERAIAIVLSGTGTNGSQGLRFIKAEGGIAIAQDPETAAFQGMPRSAIGTGIVDLVLSPDEMPQALLGLARHPYVRQPAKAIEEPTADEQLRTLLTLLRSNTRQDFGSYKRPTLLRRIHRRMGLHRIATLTDYIERLRSDPEEVKALAADLTINVTGFFRDPDAWKTLGDEVIAPLVRARPAESTIRVWVPGCSTGEEAYSLAILILEQAEAAGKTLDLRLFATDVTQAMLVSARAGAYPGSMEQDVGPERLERWFEREDGAYFVKPALRQMITFAPQNLLQDPPFSRIDLISCRNLLIYLEPEVQKQLLSLFHFALREDGHLLLGPAENISGREDLFQPVSKKWRIYRRLGPTRHDVVDFPVVRAIEPAPGAEPEAEARPEPRAGELMDRALLERYAPASALIDARYRVHYLRGPTEHYLQPPSGDPSYNLLAMAREGLQSPLRTAVRRAVAEGRKIVTHARARRSDTLHSVRLCVEPLEREREAATRLLVTFFEREATVDKAAAAEVEEARGEATLQAELDTTREDLRLTIEQMEASNEELKASNEEVRSMNEELQASNEELETSKEELQSLNEELNTVNNQLQAKVGELEERTADLNNLLNSSDVATLFLDRELRIRWFTPAMKSLLELLPTDIGRPISHFAPKFSGGDLLQVAKGVLEKLSPADAEVWSDDGRCYIRHTLPYRTEDDRIDGVVVTFVDITERKRWEQEVENAKEFAESIVDTVRDPLLVLTPELKVVSASQSFYRDFQVTHEDTEGRLVYELGNRQWDIPELRRLLEHVLPADNQFSEYEVDHEFETLGRRAMLLNGRRLDSVQLILLAIEDITERKRAEAALRANEERLRKIVETDAAGIMFFEREGTLIDANDAFLRMTGYSRSDVESRELTWRTMTPPEWIEASEQQLEQFDATGRLAPYEKEYFCKDGSRLWMLFSGADLGDGIIVEFCIDVVERKRAEQALRESEERYRTLFNSIDQGFCIIEMIFDEESRPIDYRFLDVNASFERQTGLVDAVGKTMRSFAPTHEQHWFEIYGRIALTGEPERFENPAVDLGRYYEVYAFRIGDSEERKVGILFQDITPRKRAEEERELLVRELSHRVKNILAVVQALATQTTGRIRSIEAFREAFIGRLRALARAHSVLLDAQWQSANLRTLIEQMVAAYRVDHPEVVEVEGESVTVAPKQGLGLSLVLHELGTNAAKYGALSRHEGRLRVSWQVEGDERGRRVRLRWRERQGPAVAPPGEKGFGVQLIERACAYELEGEVELDYAPEGLSCEIVFPVA